MGILIILLAIGISVGRYAIQRAQDVKHQDAVRILYTNLVKYKTTNKEYPVLGGTCTGCIEREFFAHALGYNGTPDTHILKDYIAEDGKFDGGGDATYYYSVDEYDKQFVVVCVSLGGVDDENERGYYCTGDGIGMLPEENPITDKEISSQASGDPLAIIIKNMDKSDWHSGVGFTLEN